MWAKFLIFFLLFGALEYKILTDKHQKELDLVRIYIKHQQETLQKRDSSIKELINISRQQRQIIYDYEIIIKKYQKELYYKDSLNKRAVYGQD